MERPPKDTEDNGFSKAFLALAKRAAYQSLEDFYKTLEEHDATLCESVQRICTAQRRLIAKYYNGKRKHHGGYE